MSMSERDLPEYGDPCVCTGTSGLPLCRAISVEIARHHEKQGAVDFAAMHDVAPGGAEWAALRETRVGASEAAAVFPGISITTTTQELHAKLRGTPLRKEFSEYAKRAMNEGREMEADLLYEFKQIMRDRVVLAGGLFSRTENGITLGATPDALFPYHGIVVEFKWRMHQPDWDGALGVTVFCQVQQQMHVTRTATAYVYCGCRDGRRSLWIVHYSPSYMQMWWAWMNIALAFAQEANDERPRAERGIKAQLEKFIRSEVRQHSARIQLSPPLRPVAGAPPSTPAIAPVDLK